MSYAARIILFEEPLTSFFFFFRYVDDKFLFIIRKLFFKQVLCEAFSLIVKGGLWKPMLGANTNTVIIITERIIYILNQSTTVNNTKVVRASFHSNFVSS